MADYLTNPSSVKFRDLIGRVESHRALPSGLLGNLLQRESQFDPAAESPAGARGIAQLMPIHAQFVDRDDPVASIQYSAKYLAELHDRFGDWETALAAYNWGPSNVARAQRKFGARWLEQAPEETRKYVEALTPEIQKTESARGRYKPAAVSEIDALVQRYSTKDK